jgi:histidinol-phosphate aminotransferase
VSWVAHLARPEIVALKSYEHAPWEPELTRLHANELPWRSVADDSLAGLNRYPEPQARMLLERLAGLYRVAPANLLLCRGSDEAIDLLVRGFCRAGHDAILVTPPTFGMYAVAARIQGAEVIEAPLIAASGFELDAQAVLERLTPTVKLVFLCSPNNPTGTALPPEVVAAVLDEAPGMVIVDEAYAEFRRPGTPSALELLPGRPRLVVTRTMSKAFAFAGVRVGYLAADPAVVDAVQLVRLPYHLSALTQAAARTAIEHGDALLATVEAIKEQRDRIVSTLRGYGLTVADSDANFVLFGRFHEQKAVWQALLVRGVLVRDVGLPGWLRVTAGTPEETDAFLAAMKELL